MRPSNCSHIPSYRLGSVMDEYRLSLNLKRWGYPVVGFLSALIGCSQRFFVSLR